MVYARFFQQVVVNVSARYFPSKTESNPDKFSLPTAAD